MLSSPPTRTLGTNRIWPPYRSQSWCSWLTTTGCPPCGCWYRSFCITSPRSSPGHSQGLDGDDRCVVQVSPRPSAAARHGRANDSRAACPDGGAEGVNSRSRSHTGRSAVGHTAARAAAVKGTADIEARGERLAPTTASRKSAVHGAELTVPARGGQSPVRIRGPRADVHPTGCSKPRVSMVRARTRTVWSTRVDVTEAEARTPSVNCTRQPKSRHEKQGIQKRRVASMRRSIWAFKQRP